MKCKTISLTALSILVFSCGLTVATNAQWTDNMGGTWNNPTSASIGNIINDRLWNRMRAKARARAKNGTSTSANANAPATPALEPEAPKKTPAQIDAAVRFRSTGTQLRTQAIADELSAGDTPEAKSQMYSTLSTLLTEYEKAARAQGKPNDLALAITAGLVYNSSIYNGTQEPEDSRILEIRDALAELAAEQGTFTSMTDRQKQELYETIVISTMLAKVGYEESKKAGATSTMAIYRDLAGKTLQAVSGMPPEKINFSAQTVAKEETNSPSPPSSAPTTEKSSEYLDFDPFPDKPYVQPQKPLIGRLRKTITMADLVGKWELGGASVTSYVNSSSGNYSSTDTSFFGQWYTIRANGTYESSFQGRSSNQTIRESDTGTIILDGGFIIIKSTKNPAMRNQFVSFMVQPDGAAILSLLYIGDGAAYNAEQLRGNCNHTQGYISCMGGAEWVRRP